MLLRTSRVRHGNESVFVVKPPNFLLETRSPYTFIDDFVGISDSSENLQKLIDVHVVHKFCNRWRLKANVSKCAVVVFLKSKVPGSWT